MNRYLMGTLGTGREGRAGIPYHPWPIYGETEMTKWRGGQTEIHKRMTRGESIPAYRPSETFIAPQPNQRCYEFPLRPNYMAQAVLPRDLTHEEAERVCAFIKAIAA